MKKRTPPYARAAAATLALIAIILTIIAFKPTQLKLSATETWHDLVISSERRCSPYDRADYPYPQSVERDLIAAMGGKIYGPYTGRYFSTRRDTDIDHIVALSEAHDSGLCAAGPDTRRRFASDPLNLTLAAPEINRCGRDGKCANDASEWQPPMNRCWFVARVIAVKHKYALTIDMAEAKALYQTLASCTSTDMQFTRP